MNTDLDYVLGTTDLQTTHSLITRDHTSHGLLAAPRTGLPPASDDELTNTKISYPRSFTSVLLGARKAFSDLPVVGQADDAFVEQLVVERAQADAVGDFVRAV